MNRSLLFRLLLLASLATVSARSFCQVGVWTYISHAQVSHSGGAAVTAADGRIYVFCGGSDITRCDVYDPVSDTWSQIADFPLAGRDRFDAVLGPDQKIYLFGGEDEDGNYRSGAAYDPSSNSWSPIADAPKDVLGDNVILGTDGKIYVVETWFATNGGYVLVYDPATDSWSQDPNQVPAGVKALTMSAAGPDHKLYLAGGDDELANVLNTAYSFDPHTDAWVKLPDMPGTQDLGGAAWGGDGRFYVVSGNSVSDITAFLGPDPGVQVYDPVSNSWSAGPNVNLQRAFAPTVEGLDGSIYTLTGFQLKIGSTTTAERFIPNLLSVRGATVSATEGASFSGTVATITDHRNGQTPADFTATIAWGDGVVTTASITSGVQTGTFAVSGAHTYSEAGTYATSIHVDDADSESATGAGQANVTDADLAGHPLNFSASANVIFTGKVGSFTDANPAPGTLDYTGAIAWGDGLITPASITANGSGGFDVAGAHSYHLPGPYTVAISIHDPEGASVTFQSHCTVGAPTPQVAAGNIKATEGVAFSGQVGHFTDADPTLTAGSFTASVAWGDGTTTTGSVASDGSGGFNVSGAHTYAEEGAYAVTVSVSTAGGTPGVSSSTATVADAPLTGTGYRIPAKYRSFSGVVATFIDADASGTVGDYKATILWGDGGSSVGTIKAASGSFSVSGSHSYQKKLVFTAQVLITDLGGATTTVTTMIDMTRAK